MNKKIILLISLILVLAGIAFVLKPKPLPKQITNQGKGFNAIPEKYELTKDPRYLACVEGANNVVKKFNEGNERMILITCKQIERMKIEDLKNSCLMGSIGLLHFIDQKEFIKLKGQKAIDWTDQQFCQKFNDKTLKK